MEQLERAVQEVEALHAIYEENFTVYSKTELRNAQMALVQYQEQQQQQQQQQDPDQRHHTDDSQFEIPQLEIGLRIPVGDSIGNNNENNNEMQTLLLHFSLPPGYPESSPAQIQISGFVHHLSNRVQQDDLHVKMNQKANALIGNEAIMVLVQEFEEMIVDHEQMQDDSKPSPEAESSSAAAAAAAEEPATPNTIVNYLERRWIWAHHIIDPARRKSIVKESSDAGLSGYLKPGYPGIVVVEGDASACEDFVCWIKGSKSRPGGFGRNWGHHVKGEIRIMERVLPIPFRELDEGMKELGALCKECGLNSEFLEYVMQQK